jgi:hypothetical protein
MSIRRFVLGIVTAVTAAGALALGVTAGTFNGVYHDLTNQAIKISTGVYHDL